MAYTIERYSPSCGKEWDEFISRSKNGTFLFLRGYMDYHSDRFEDFSLIARDSRNKIAALLPANVKGETLNSHGGLTYGGWVGACKGFDVISLMEIQTEANRFLHGHGFKEILYKPVPYIYSEIPSQEDLYILFRNKATLAASQISSAINLATDAGPDADRRRKARTAREKGVEIMPSEKIESFWEILSTLLGERYNTTPVHSLDEIRLLMNRFPDNIRLFTAEAGGEVVAGSVMYLSRGVAHSQYIAASPRGKELNALSLLFSELIALFRKDGYRWFDFGISTEHGGEYLNTGLTRQKNTLGGRGVVYNIYSMPVNP